MDAAYRFDRDRTTAELRAAHGGLAPGHETGVRVRVAGRLLLLRRHGGVTFARLHDGHGAIQILVERGSAGPELHRRFARLRRGAWVGVEGEVVTSRRGELSVRLTALTLLGEARRPLPDKWRGLRDVNLRHRQRYLDLMVNESTRRIFDIRSQVVAGLRERLRGRGFTEVEGPMLGAIQGGAAATPFITHHDALDVDLYLRIALELHLKRLIVGGLDRVFEIGRVFRNEGFDRHHNPEFTMLEAYEAYGDYHTHMALTEELVAHLALELTGSTTVTFDDRPVDLSAPWRRAPLAELTSERVGEDVSVHTSPDRLRELCDRHGVPHDHTYGPGKLLLELYEKTTEATLWDPTFVVDYPAEVSPLSRRHRDDPELTERFEAIVVGRELCNGFSELTDPDDQRSRFEDQAARKAAGDAEAMAVDADYLRALDYGLPPTVGLGIGMDRLVMLLSGTSSIRDVVLFPTLRPEPPERERPDSPSGESVESGS